MKIPNYYARTETNQRENNEDCHHVFWIDDLQIPVLVIADGMGGHEHGEDVSRQAVLKVEDFLQKTIDQVSDHASAIDYLKQCLLDAIHSANALVQRMTEVNGWDRAGSTIVIALIWQNKVIAANLGDSPLFHWSQRTETLDRITQDHSVPGILAQANLITEEMARYHERRGQLEFFLGGKTLPKPDPVYDRTLESGDLLLLCSDGISGALSREQLQAILAAASEDLSETVEHLLQAAKNAGETDNQTVILWRYDSARQSSTILQHSLSTSLSLSLPRTPSLCSEPPRPRRKRSLSRKTAGLILATSLAGAIVLGWIILQTPGFIQAQMNRMMPQSLGNPPVQRPHEFDSITADRSILTTRNPNTHELFEWGTPVLEKPGGKCRSNIPSKAEKKQIVINRKAIDFIVTKSESTGCIRTWKLKSDLESSQLTQPDHSLPVVSNRGEPPCDA